MPGKKSSVSPKTQKKFIKVFWITCVSVILFFLLLFSFIPLGIFGKMPSFEELENPKSNLATEIYSSDHEILGKYYIENRSNIHFRELSPNIINAAGEHLPYHDSTQKIQGSKNIQESISKPSSVSHSG